VPTEWFIAKLEELGFVRLSVEDASRNSWIYRKPGNKGMVFVPKDDEILAPELVRQILRRHTNLMETEIASLLTFH